MGALVLAVAAVGGCGQEVAGTPNNAGVTGADPATSELAALDPCTLLSDAEIEALGFRRTPGAPPRRWVWSAAPTWAPQTACSAALAC